MPRRAFVEDLRKAVEGVTIAGISEVEQGNDDGEFTFICVADGQELKISCLIPELSDYPSSHMCMIFAPDNAPASVAGALNDISDLALGKSVLQILELVANRLESTDDDGDHQMVNSQEVDDFDEYDVDEDDEEEYFPGDEDMLPKPVVTAPFGSGTRRSYTEATPALRARIRRDLLAAKAAGFKVGYQGGLMDGLGCYVSLSTRITKLGISEEAMKAWQLEPNEYLVVIFQYPNGYKSMDDLKSYDHAQARRSFGMRVGISTTYKPSLQEAVLAFTVLSKEQEKQREASQAGESQQTGITPGGFRNSFISRPLNELLEQRFALLLKYRYSGMPWHGAEAFHNAQVSRSVDSSQTASEDRFYEPEEISTAYPSVVTADHITESTGSEHSLPLVGIQFALRHFVRCTEFCLICFSKMPDDLQAIKPYVCDNPLCLYQYMSLGFGPSIEHEILSQPKVVDLLVSFCYTSARVGRLQDFPSGLSLAVPPPLSSDDYKSVEMNHNYNRYGQPQPPQPQNVISKAKKQTPCEMRYSPAGGEMLFSDKSQSCPVSPGNWIIIRTADAPDKPLHCRVLDIALYPSVRVSETIEPSLESVSNDFNQWKGYHKPTAPVPPSKPTPSPASKHSDFRAATFYIYNQNFDDLSDFEKRQAICTLLDVLPPIEEMKKFLHRKAQSPLSAWSDRLSPAVLGLLRWIIASNRACILQVDGDETVKNGRKAEDKLYGMEGWTQFRFAMGAPDKERRFIQAVRSTSDRLHLRFPTLFAWHGSPLQNWHSIIREGLHYKDISHGRAYGNGVYHATDVSTSLGYSGYGGAITWTNSELKIQQALALNEIVNAPQEYVSSSPFLVVSQLDWIQTRYLFINTRPDPTGNVAPTKGQRPLQYLEQDPKMTPRGVTDALVIPIHAISGSRRPKPKSTSQNKRQKATGTSKYDPIEIDIDVDDGASVVTDDEDRDIFEDDVMEIQSFDFIPTPNSLKPDKGKSSISSFASKMMGSALAAPLTDYVPGTLDYSTLPMLQMPAWAATSATKRLMRDFKDMIHVQNTTPPHELGWHIDEDKIDNMYQWIIELHSFDAALPLAQDMKKQNVKSVVLELRFGKDYPMSPPFVRVIRPRFLGFQQGGGGHVTAGGAMCMQLLTNDGWSAVSSIESVLLQVRMAISSTEPKPARLERGGRMDYGVGEAVEAYMRACAVHGWTVPPGFREMAYGGSSEASFRPF